MNCSTATKGLMAIDGSMATKGVMVTDGNVDGDGDGLDCKGNGLNGNGNGLDLGNNGLEDGGNGGLAGAGAGDCRQLSLNGNALDGYEDGHGGRQRAEPQLSEGCKGMNLSFVLQK